MKKQLCKLAIFALLLSTASCADEQFAGDLTGGETTVTFNAQLPAGLQTRTAGDGETANTLSYAVYEHGTTTPVITSEDEVNFVNRRATLSLKLAKGKTYDFLFWADSYGKDAEENPYTVDFGSQTLTVNYDNALSNDESRDAFFGKATVEVKGAVSQNITLKRPFAQLNIGTNDMEEAKAAGLNTGDLQSSVTVSGIFKSMNLMSGEVFNSVEDVTFGLNAIPEETFTADGRTFNYLALNYLLVSKEKGLVNCKFTYTDGATTDNTLTIDNVPVQRNYRTNIFGSLLTGSVDFDITIDPDFTSDFNYQELLLAAKNGGKVVLTSDVTITDEMPVVVDGGNTLVIDLAGKKLTRSGADNGQSGVWALRVNDGTIIIDDSKGTGSIEGGAGLEHVTLWAHGEHAKIIIKGGNITVGGNDTGNIFNNCVYASNKGQVEIYGGTFENAAPQTGTNIYPSLNQQNGNPGKITVYGGTFKNYDPATGDDYLKGTFVAKGYSSVKISEEPSPYGTYRVVEGTGVASGTDISEALEKGKELITLAADVTIEPAAFASVTKSTIDLNGQTLTFGKAETLYVPEGGNLTFRNGEIVANDFDATATIISANEGSSITLDGVTINTTGTGIGPADYASDVTIEIRNSELNCGAYGFATNAKMPVGNNVKIILADSKFSASEPVFINIPCEATIDNCDLDGTTHGMVLRGGKATVSNSTITLTYTDDDYATIGSYFDNKNWGVGNALNIAALTVGNKGTGSAYQYPSELHLINTTVESAGQYGSYFPALYAWANQGEGLGVTITYDSATQFKDDLVYGSYNITVNGKAAEITE